MDHLARYDAAEIMNRDGFNACVKFIRGHIRCINTAHQIASEIAHLGE